MPSDKKIHIPLVILAGGKATRLKHLAADTPKYLMKIDENSVFADHHLTWAKKMGFEKVLLSTGHLGEKVKAYCGDGSKYGLKIVYVDEGNDPRGTGGALKLIPSEHLTQGAALTYGDTLLNIDCEKLCSEGIRSGYPVVMSFYLNQVPDHTNNGALMEPHKEFPLLNKALYSKTNPEKSWKYIDYGFMYLGAGFFSELPTAEKFDLAEPLEKISTQGKLLGWEGTSRFWEIGSPEALQEFREKALK